MLANVVVFDTFHTLALINIRFYLNPYNLVIEPIPTDNYYNLASANIIDYKKKLGGASIIFRVLYDDESFRKEYNISLIRTKNNLKKIKKESYQICKYFERYCNEIMNFEDIENHVDKLIKLGNGIFPKFKPKKKTGKQY